MKPKFSTRLSLRGVPADTSTDPVALPRIMEGSGDRAALLIHGFTGSPHDMRFLGERLNDSGWTVSIPRLPGHGTSGRDFLNTTRRDWLRRAIDAYADLRSSFAHIDVCGLSMGGVIAIILASRFPVRRLALAAPAVDVTSRLMWAAPWIGPFVPRVDKEPDPEDLADPALSRLTREYWSAQWNRPAAELYRLMKQARRRLSEVKAPTLTIVSKLDDTVPLQAANRIERDIGADTVRTTVLEESAHVVTNDSQRDEVAALVRDWFSYGR